ncbi:uncharacterized protein GGS25DRAFT_434119 [Hypoxylon fragiforme]|uniref:uncharacterized protein n=1 Tax=Hypoxylon fragiforme TaxID=63214 RepID=UPI0020C5E25E|nr:uncharacterized protein GGS25DRAFT_434119 [Hypoxylon fragiforme]KAI2605527.1 hypothetical protein GGS25DRAFT_434119 [Hypoxylon fragiforme]
MTPSHSRSNTKAVDEGLDLPHTAVDEALLHRPRSNLGSAAPKSSSTSTSLFRPREAMDRSTATTESHEELECTIEGVQQLKEQLDSSCKIAERLVQALLRKIAHLREALAKCDAERKAEAAGRRQADVRTQATLNTVCDERAKLRAEVQCYRDIVGALEESLKDKRGHFDNEQLRDQEIYKLSEEIRKAKAILFEERIVSRAFSQQIEAMYRVIQIQHNELKERKSNIEDLERYIQIIDQEYEQLQRQELATKKLHLDREAEYNLARELSTEVYELRKTVSEVVENKRSVQAQLEQEQQTTLTLRQQVYELERQKGDMTISLSIRQRTPDPGPRIGEPGLNCEGSGSSAGDLDAQAADHTPTRVALQEQMMALRVTNRKMEEELQGFREIIADLTGFYPLERVPNKLSNGAPSASLEVLVADTDDEIAIIPEPRLPSPVSGLHRKGNGPSLTNGESSTANLESFHSTAKGEDENSSQCVN